MLYLLFVAYYFGHTKNCRLCDQGKIIFEEQKDNLVYNYGVAKCGKEKFAQLSSDDYIIHRTTNMSVECLVHDKEAFKRKYKNIIVDNATLEDIMLFYVKVQLRNVKR